MNILHPKKLPYNSWKFRKLIYVAFCILLLICSVFCIGKTAYAWADSNVNKNNDIPQIYNDGVLQITAHIDGYVKGSDGKINFQENIVLENLTEDKTIVLNSVQMKKRAGFDFSNIGYWKVYNNNETLFKGSEEDLYLPDFELLNNTSKTFTVETDLSGENSGFLINKIPFDFIYDYNAEDIVNKKAYACLKSSNSENDTLEFRYDNQMDQYEHAWECENTAIIGWIEWLPYITTPNGTVKTVNFDSYFRYARPKYCFNWFGVSGSTSTIQAINNLRYLKTYKTTDMSFMFYGCSQISELDVSGFDVTNVTNMGAMFYLCSGLTSPPDVSNWNTENVTRMWRMFSDCSGLTIAPDVSSWNTENVIDMSYLFENCSQIKTVDVHNFNMAKVSNLTGMFYNCSELINIYCNDNWSILQIYNTSQMFYGCTKLPHYTSSRVDKTYAYPDDGETGYFTFKGSAYACLKSSNSENDNLEFRYDDQMDKYEHAWECNSSTEEPSWLDYIDADLPTGSVTTVNFDQSFRFARPTTTTKWFYSKSGDSSIKEINNINVLNTSKTVDMSYMFANCSNLSSLSLNSLNVGNVIDMSFMFYGCRELENIYCDFNWNETATSIENSSFMFSGCFKLPNFSAFVVDITYAYPDDGETGYFVKNPIAYACLKSNESENDTLEFRLDNEFANYEHWWECENTGKTLPGWTEYVGGVSGKAGTVKIVNFDESFSDARPTSCYNWLSSYNTSSSTIEEVVNLNMLNTSETTNMTYMFYGNNKITELDVSSFDVAKVSQINLMFSGCSNLTNIMCNQNWVISAKYVTQSFDMFYNCTKLPHFTSSKTDITYAYPDNGASGYFTPLHMKVLLNSFEGGHYEDESGNVITEIEGEYKSAGGFRVVVDDPKMEVLQVVDSRGVVHEIGDSGWVDFVFNYNTNIDVVLKNKNAHMLILDANGGSVEGGNEKKLWTIRGDNKTYLDPAGVHATQIPTCSADYSEFIGYFTQPEGGEKVLNADGTFAGAVDGYTDGSAWICEDDTRLYAHYEYATIAYACLKSSNSENDTLEFRLDNEFTNYEHWWECENTGTTKPGWSEYVGGVSGKAGTVKTVNFDESFSDARPTSCHSWFFAYNNASSTIENITGLNLLNTSSVLTMQSMFDGCSKIIELDVSSFNVLNVTDMKYMFYGCKELVNIYCDQNWRNAATSITSSSNMFQNCTKLPHFTSSKTDITYAYPDNGASGYFTPLHMKVLLNIFEGGHYEDESGNNITEIEGMRGEIYSVKIVIDDPNREIKKIVDSRSKEYSLDEDNCIAIEMFNGEIFVDLRIKNSRELTFDANGGEMGDDFSANNIVEIGTGTNAGYNAPMNTYYKYSTNETIYLRDEIGQAGTISKIYYNVASPKETVCDAFNVYLAHTTQTGFTSQTSWVDAASLSLVYSSNNQVIGSSTGWEEIILDTPFEYNGVDNLAVIVCKHCASYTNQLKYFYTSNNYRCIYKQNDSTATFMDPTVMANGTVANTMTNIRFEISDPKPKEKQMWIINGYSNIFSDKECSVTGNMPISIKQGAVFIGYFTQPEGGEKVLNADGAFADAVDGYTDGSAWICEDDSRLYAHYSPTNSKMNIERKPAVAKIISTVSIIEKTSSAPQEIKDTKNLTDYNAVKEDMYVVEGPEGGYKNRVIAEDQNLDVKLRKEKKEL